jgi:ATP synthase protein I
MTSIPRPPVYRIPLVQLVMLLPLVAGLWAMDQLWGQSALAGGLIAVIPNLYFTSYAFRYRGARSAKLIVRAFNRGETGKFLLTLVGFGGVFTLVRPISVSTLFLVYVAMIAVQWWMNAKVIDSSSKR